MPTCLFGPTAVVSNLPITRLTRAPRVSDECDLAAEQRKLRHTVQIAASVGGEISPFGKASPKGTAPNDGSSG